MEIVGVFTASLPSNAWKESQLQRGVRCGPLFLIYFTTTPSGHRLYILQTQKETARGSGT